MHFCATAATQTADTVTDPIVPLHLATTPILGLPSKRPDDQPTVQVPHVNADATDFVAVSRFSAAQGIDLVKQAFRERPHHVDSAAGFVRMDVLSPCDAPNEIWLITYWKDESSYRTWHHSHLYKESHQGIPKGLRLVPKSVSIRFFEHVAS